MSYLTNPYMVTASGGASLSTASTDAYYCCGIEEGGEWVTEVTTQNFDSGTWTTGTNANQALATNEGRGNQTGFMICGGFSSTTAFPALDDAYSWNGSAWTTHSSVMGEVRAIGFAMSGNDAGGFINGGQQGSGGTQQDTSESFDSTPTFTTEASSDYGGQGTLGSGNSDTDFIRTGGYGTPASAYNLETESYSGGAWTCESQDYPFSNPYGYGGSCASGRTSFLCGSNVNSTDDAIAKFDGSTWADAGDMNYKHTTQHGEGGDSADAMVVSGDPDANKAELYDGDSFTTTGELVATNGLATGGCGGNS